MYGKVRIHFGVKPILRLQFLNQNLKNYTVNDYRTIIGQLSENLCIQENSDII